MIQTQQQQHDEDGVGYGSIVMPNVDDDGHDHSEFSTDHTYYLKTNHKKKLSPEQRYKHVLLVTVPIIAAILIVGGAAFLVYQDFNHLYPGQGHEQHNAGQSIGGHTATSPSTPVSTTTAATTTTTNKAVIPSPATSPTHMSVAVPVTTPVVLASKQQQQPVAVEGNTSNIILTASCLAYPNCDGLIGDCCPTADGIVLDCCN